MRLVDKIKFYKIRHRLHSVCILARPRIWAYVVGEHKVLSFVAILATIIGIGIALFIFASESCTAQALTKNEYLNQLGSLSFELNEDSIILQFFSKDTNGYYSGQRLPYFRYSVLVKQHLVEEGKIRDESLRQEIDDLLASEQTANRIMDELGIIAISNASSQTELQQFVTKLGLGGQALKSTNERIATILPKVMVDLIVHFQLIRNKPLQWYCIR